MEWLNELFALAHKDIILADEIINNVAWSDEYYEYLKKKQRARNEGDSLLASRILINHYNILDDLDVIALCAGSSDSEVRREAWGYIEDINLSNVDCKKLIELQRACNSNVSLFAESVALRLPYECVSRELLDLYANEINMKVVHLVQRLRKKHYPDDYDRLLGDFFKKHKLQNRN